MATKVSADHVKTLTNLGFTKSKSEKALKDYKNNLAQAKSYLVRSKQEEDAKILREVELQEKLKQADDRRKQREEEEHEKYQQDLARAMKESLLMNNNVELRSKNANDDDGDDDEGNNNFGSNDDHDGDDEDEEDVELHPCISQYGKCRYGLKCAWREYPADTCINYLQGTCIFGDQCRNRHRYKGQNLRDGLRFYEEDRTIEIPDPNDPSSLIVIKDLKSKVCVAERIPNAFNSETNLQLLPEKHLFNSEFTSRPSYSKPLNNNHNNQDEEGQHHHESLFDDETPTPFLDKMRNTNLHSFNTTASSIVMVPQQQQNSIDAKKTNLNGKIYNISEISNIANGKPKNASKTRKIPKHPCVYQRGSCKFGSTCVHADLPGDICVHWLNSRCLFDKADCRFKHHFGGDDDEDDGDAADAVLLQGNIDHRNNLQEQEQLPLLTGFVNPTTNDSTSFGNSGVNSTIQRQLMEILGVSQQQQQQPQQQPEFSSTNFGGFNVSTKNHQPSKSLWQNNNNNQSSRHTPPSLMNNNNNNNTMIRSAPPMSMSDKEEVAFSSLRAAFPQVDPSAIILTLRRCNGDVKQAGSCVLDFAEGAVEFVAEYYEHHTSEFFGSNPSSPVSPATNGNSASDDMSIAKSEENRTIALVVLCGLLPSFEPEALQEMLENNGWSFEQAFAEAHTVLDAAKRGKKSAARHNKQNGRSILNKINAATARNLRNNTNNSNTKSKSVWFSGGLRFKESSNDFPQSSSTANIINPSSPANKLQLRKLEAMFPELDSAIIEHTFRSLNLSVDATRQTLLQMSENCRDYTIQKSQARLKHREMHSSFLLSNNHSSSQSSSIVFGAASKNSSNKKSERKETRQTRFVNEALEKFYNNIGESDDDDNDDDENDSDNADSSSDNDESFDPSDLYKKTKQEIDLKQEAFDWRRARQEAYLTNIARQRTASCAVTAFARGDAKIGASLMKESKRLASSYARLNMLCMLALEREQDRSVSGVTTLDLHGFHLKEALSVLSRRLKLCREKGIPRLRVIAGVGSHSKDARPVVLPAAKEFVEELSAKERWCFLAANSNSNENFLRNGMFDVVIKREY